MKAVREEDDAVEGGIGHCLAGKIPTLEFGDCLANQWALPGLRCGLENEG